MPASRPLGPSPSAADGGEARLLPILEGLRSFALEALRAVESGDAGLLMEILARRQRLQQEAEPLLERVRSPAGGTPAPARREVLRTLRGIEVADARLAAAVNARRASAASELDRMRRRSTEGAGYSLDRARARRGRIDLFR